VRAVGGQQLVLGPQGGDRADGGSLLADREVAVPADPGALVLPLGLLLEQADQHHVAHGGEQVERALRDMGGSHRFGAPGGPAGGTAAGRGHQPRSLRSS